MMDVQTLLRGVAEIDRKRLEIKQVMNLLMRAVTTLHSKNRFESCVICIINERWEWRLNVNAHNTRNYELYFDFLDRDRIIYRFDTWRQRDQRAIELELVEFLHKSLSAFVEGMENEFPSLSAELQPILSASSTHSQ